MQIDAIERRTTADLVVERIAGVIKEQNLSAGERLTGLETRTVEPHTR